MGETLEVGDDQLRNALRVSVQALREEHGRIDPPWSEVNRLVRGEVDEGVGGGPDLLHAVYGDFEEGRFAGIAGDAYVLFVMFAADGTVTSEAVHQFGSATLDQDSPHYADQVELFVDRRLRPVWYEAVDILANLEVEYRPGERP